ncbi:WD repeat-containing protein 91 isoform X2 [Leptinotarsa decemlineata]|uniref:WD repeat-containing protein 91 isoform X2 n=1 Tax=Leptinotarsa decemlineata TaxID=7539 RepID=UPI003D3071E3
MKIHNQRIQKTLFCLVKISQYCKLQQILNIAETRSLEIIINRCISSNNGELPRKMAHTQFLDEIIREYLLFRGFGNTLKAFDADLKGDKMKSFRADRIVDQIMHFINVHDLASLREFWGHLNMHLFSKLEHNFLQSVKKLENAVLKMYLVSAVTNNKPEKMIEFFMKMTPELKNQTLPYTKNPDENKTFALYFTKQWQDTLLLSLTNFFATVIQHMPMPTLMNYTEDAQKITKLQERNESLKKRLVLLLDRDPKDDLKPCEVDPPRQLMDDFFCIAPETVGETQARGFRNLIRNMSASPILGKKDNSGTKKKSGAGKS